MRVPPFNTYYAGATASPRAHPARCRAGSASPLPVHARAAPRPRRALAGKAESRACSAVRTVSRVVEIFCSKAAIVQEPELM